MSTDTSPKKFGFKEEARNRRVASWKDSGSWEQMWERLECIQKSAFLKRLNSYPVTPTIPLLGLNPGQMKTYVHTKTHT